MAEKTHREMDDLLDGFLLQGQVPAGDGSDDPTGIHILASRQKTMSEILPDSSTSLSGWTHPIIIFYEIRNRNNGTEAGIQLSLSSRDIPDNLRAVCDKIIVHYPLRQQKANWLWRTPFTTKPVKIDEDINEEKIFVQLDKRLEEIMAFEIRLKEQIG